MHDLRTRRAGADLFIELDDELSLEQAHDIAHEVEARIRAAFPAADIIVHQEPAGLADAPGCADSGGRALSWSAVPRARVRAPA